MCYEVMIQLTIIIFVDHWINPNVTGDTPPPINGLSLSKISNEKTLLYGGNTAQGPSSELRVATVVGDSVVSTCMWTLIYMYVGFSLVCSSILYDLLGDGSVVSIVLQ